MHAIHVRAKGWNPREIRHRACSPQPKVGSNRRQRLIFLRLT